MAGSPDLIDSTIAIETMEIIKTSGVIESVEVIEPIMAELVTEELMSEGSGKKSWILRLIKSAQRWLDGFFGVASIVFCIAIVANIPILQFLAFGYLLETSGRIARGGKLSDGLVGIKVASRLGGVLLGTWLLLIPIRFFSDNIWYESYLIDPNSRQTAFLRVLQILLVIATIFQIVAAWLCGGKFRYFFWQVIAPFSFGIWLLRRFLATRFAKPVLRLTLGWISTKLPGEICHVESPSDWFVPAILWKRFRHGGWYIRLRDDLWSFASRLNLWHYWKKGVIGFVGSSFWLLVPTALLVAATRIQGTAAILFGVLGVLLAIPSFALLAFVQTHFAANDKISSFWRLNEIFSIIVRAPIVHVISLFLTLLFAVPLFLLKIEEIPADLLWTLSIVFVIFSWPSRLALGLAYRRGARKTDHGRLWIRGPILSFCLPVSISFVLILTLTRYISWNGAFSMIENHVFLLPAPFWL